MCYSTCLPRFYPNTNTLVCDHCPYDCYTCDSLNNCSSCNNSTDFRELYLNSTSNVTRCVPLNGYYDNLTTISIPCPLSCKTCLNASFCTSCPNGYFLRIDHQCYTTCLVRYYSDSSTNTCKDCPYDCYTCDGNGGCLTCNSTTDFRELVSIRCAAIAGYYDNATRVSLICPSVCKKCVSSNNCSQCVSGYYLRTDSYCYTTCPTVFYADNLTLTCIQCPIGCSSCANSSYCFECLNYYLRSDNLCYSSCL